MAYLLKRNLDDDAAQGGNGVISTGPAPVPGAAPVAPGAQPAAAAANPQPASNFVSFDRYFDANKQSAGATADKLASGIQADASKAKSQIGGLQSQFNKGMQQGGVSAPVAHGYGYVESQGRPLAGKDGKPISVAEAQRLAGSGYTGPNSLTDVDGYEGVSGAVKTAGEKAANLGSQAGTQAQLAAMQTGAYSQGQSAFDAALTNRAGGDRFNQLRGQFGALSQYLDGAVLQSGEQATAASTRSANAAKGYQRLLNNYESEQNDIAAQANDKKIETVLGQRPSPGANLPLPSMGGLPAPVQREVAAAAEAAKKQAAAAYEARKRIVRGQLR